MSNLSIKKMPGIGITSVLAFLWLASTAWMRPLMLPDEGRYVGVAWEMLRSGEWLTPTLNGLPYFHKPPLFYWITAGSMAIFGHYEWAARMASMLGATLGAMALYALVRRWSGERMARLCLFTLMAMPLMLVGGQFANLDMLVAGCITATVAALAHAALSHEQGVRYRTALNAAYALAGLGVLAKGLIGFVLPGLVIGSWLLARRRWTTLYAMFSVPGVAVFGMLTVPWFLVMQSRFPGFLNYFFVVQHFKRFASGGFNNVQPFWFYPAVLALFCLPWLIWLARGVRSRGGVGRFETDPLHGLMLIWVAVIVGFFSLPSSKLLGYVLPAVPPLAYLITSGYVQSGRDSRASLAWWRSIWLVAVLVSWGAMVWLSVHPRDTSRAVGSVLMSQRQASEPVLMLRKYWFDLPYYAQLNLPVTIVDDWTDPAILRKDNERKEIRDAGGFASAEGRQRLKLPTALRTMLCQVPVSWVMVEAKAVQQWAFLSAIPPAFSQGSLRLLRVDSTLPTVAKTLGCTQEPHP